MEKLMKTASRLLPSQISKRSFGIEIESVIAKCSKHQSRSDVLDSLNTNIQDMSSWHMIEDKSIETNHTKKLEEDPFIKCELVSPKLEYETSTLDKLESICDNLTNEMNANINDSCGVHIHFDAEDLSLHDILSIACNYSFFEDVIDLFMDKTRRENNNKYIKSLRDPIYNNLENLETIFECDHYKNTNLSILDMINPNRKCSKLNFVNYFYYNLGKIGISKQKNKYINTIENRHHHGSLNYVDILYWINFNLLFIHHSRNKPAFLLQNKTYNDYYHANIQNESLYEDEHDGNIDIDIESEQPAIDPVTKFNILAEFIEDDEVIQYYQQKINHLALA